VLTQAVAVFSELCHLKNRDVTSHLGMQENKVVIAEHGQAHYAHFPVIIIIIINWWW
jgi:hypothetical protein